MFGQALLLRHARHALRASTSGAARRGARPSLAPAPGRLPRFPRLPRLPRRPFSPAASPFSTSTGDDAENAAAVALDDRRPHILERLFTDNTPPHFDDEEERAALRAGRSWRASELRLKSFEDLHALWFVLLRERNLLETMRNHSKTEGVAMANPARLKKVRKSMARLKTVLKERSIEHEKRQALLLES
jgi:large subunit ribosomal protein L47